MSRHYLATVENESGQVFWGTYSELEFGGTPNKRGLSDDARMLGVLDAEASIFVHSGDLARIEANLSVNKDRAQPLLLTGGGER